MSWLISLLAGAAIASPARSYPVVGTFAVEDQGAHRVDLDGAWLSRCPDPTSYLITDPDGVEVPFAARTSDQHPPALEALTWEPVQISRYRWSYRVHGPVSGARVRALRIRKLPRGTVARVEVWKPSEAHRHASLVWNLPDSGADVQDRVALPDDLASGPWRVDVHIISCLHWHARVEFEALTEHTGQVGEVAVTLPAGEPVPLDASVSELVARMPRAGLPVRWVEVDPREEVFSRPVTLSLSEGGRRGGALERVQVEGVQLEQTRIVWRGTADRQLKMQIRDGRSPALTVDALTVGLRGVALLLPEVEAGTYTIYGCGPAGRGYDLDRLGETLAQQPAPRVMAGSPVLNQDWSRGLVADGLAAPVPRVAKWSFSETLEVQAEPGLVRVPLPVSVKAGTRDGLPDLRFETPGGEVVPHVVEHIGSERVVGVRWRQEEIGNLTRLHLVLPESNLHVERLVLRAERARFLRKVHLKANGLTLVTAEWSGTGEVESRLVVDLDRRVPREIWVELDNRDSMPLPLLEPELTTPAWEARLIAPQTGVDLRYGSTTMRRPSFDLELVRAQVLDSPAAEASLMRPAPPPVVRRPSSPTPLLSEPRGSRWVLLAIAILAIVMGGLAMRLSTEADQEDEVLR